MGCIRITLHFILQEEKGNAIEFNFAPFKMYKVDTSKTHNQ